jgi:NitT/TauT family transport system substrate-binding protein
LITAVITGEVDVAGVAITPGLFAASQRGIGIRIVGDKQSIRPGFSNTRLMLRADEFHDDKKAAIAGLRGKTLGVTSYGSTAFYLMATTLAQNNIKLEDIRTVEMSYPNIVLALSNKAIDAGMLLEPYLSQAIQSGVAVELSDCVDAAPPGNPSIVAIVYSELFAAKRDIAERWMIAYMRGVRAYNDAYVKNFSKDNVIDSIARHTHIDRTLIARGFPVGLDPNQQINLAALEDFQKFFLEIGLLRKPSNFDSLIDTSFATNAVKVLGPYTWQ